MSPSPTRLKLCNETSGTRRMVRLPTSVADVVSRLRQAIDPAADEFDPYDDTVSTYATARGRAITLVAYGCDREAARAELNRILAQLRRALP